MGTKRQHVRRNRDEVRAAAIEAALVQFAAQGYDATSVQAIAKQVSMSKQALMHHFPTKESLREGVYGWLGERFEAALPVFLDGLMTSEGPTVEVFDVIAETFENNAVVARFLMRELLDNPQQASQWLWERSAPFFQMSEDAANPDVDVDATPHSIACAALMLTNATFLSDVQDPWRSKVRTATRLLLKRGSSPDAWDSPRDEEANASEQGEDA